MNGKYRALINDLMTRALSWGAVFNARMDGGGMKFIPMYSTLAPRQRR
jgi:hypothetical protein